MIKRSALTLIRTPLKTTLIVIFLSGVICMAFVGIGMYINGSNAINEIRESFVTTAQISFKRGALLDRMADMYGYNNFSIYGMANVESIADVVGGGGGNLNSLVFLDEILPIINSDYVESFNTKYSTYGSILGANRILLRYFDGIDKSKRMYEYDDIFVGRILDKNIVSSRQEGAHTIYEVEVTKRLRGEIEENSIITLTMYEPVGLLYVGTEYILGAEKVSENEYVSEQLSQGLANDNVVLKTEPGMPSSFNYYVRNYRNDKETYDALYAFTNAYPFGVQAATVEFTNNVELSTDFRNSILSMVDGRVFTEEEYHNGDNVAIVGEIFAERNGLSIGDSISVTLLLQNWNGEFSEALPPDDLESYEEYTIVGLYKVESVTNYFEPNVKRYNSVYVPLNSYKNSDAFVEFFNKTMRTEINNLPKEQVTEAMKEFIDRGAVYYLDQSIIKLAENGTQNQFVEDIINNGFDMTQFYISFDDQGFGAINPALQELRRASLYLIYGCAAAGIAAVLFIIYIFVVKSRKETAVMMCLGEKKSGVIKSMYIKIFVLTSFSLAIGLTAGSLVAKQALSFAYNTYYNAQFDKLSLYQHKPSGFVFNIQPTPAAYVITIVCVMLLTFGISGYIVMQTLKTEPIEALSSAGKQG